MSELNEAFTSYRSKDNGRNGGLPHLTELKPPPPCTYSIPRWPHPAKQSPGANAEQ